MKPTEAIRRTRRMRSGASIWAKLSCAAALTVACGGSEDRPAGVDPGESGGSAGAPNGATGGSSGGAIGDAAVAPPSDDYPPGPYGEGNPSVGDRIENLAFMGVIPNGSSSDAAYTSYTMADLRDSGAPYALLHVATVWCSSCRAAAGDVGAREQEVLDAGGAIVELVLEGQSRSEPTESELRAWMGAHDLSVPTVGPADARTKVVFPDREYAYVVDLETMTVVWRERGLYATPTIGDVGIDATLARL